VVFFATPNGIAMQQAASLLEAGVKVVDLAADFRIKDIALWEKWYGMSMPARHWSPRRCTACPR
jgi:N-acetyl-gamma-glutamyl-phosphate reductase